MAGEKIRKIFRRLDDAGGANALGAGGCGGVEDGGEAVADDGQGGHGEREREHGRGDGMLGDEGEEVHGG